MLYFVSVYYSWSSELLSGEFSVWTSENPEKTYSYCVQENF